MSNSKIIVAAGLAGVAVGMLIAPKKGTELQKSILDSIDELSETAKDIREKVLSVAGNLKEKAISVKENVEDKVEHVKDGIDDVKTTADHLKSIFS